MPMGWTRFHELFGAIIAEAAAKRKLDPAVIGGIIMTESAGNPRAVSHCGARGLMQLMPATAKEDMRVTDPFDPKQNVEGGCEWFSRILKFFAGGDIKKACAGYNAGPGNLKACVSEKCTRPKPHARWEHFKETRDYIPRVVEQTKRYRAFLDSITVR